MKNTFRNILAGATLAGALIAGGQSFADYNKLVDTLVAKGSLTAEEAAKLKVQPVKPASKFVDSLAVRGRIQTQAAYVDGENDKDSGDYSTFEIRRARIGLRGEFPGKVRAEVEANVKPGEGETNVSSAYIQWRQHKPAYVTTGFVKPLSSMEENMSSASIITVERSLINNTVAAPGESVGILVEGTIAPLFYGVGVFTDQGVDSTINTPNEEAEYLFNARGGVDMELSETSNLMVMASYMSSDDEEGNVGGDFEEVTVLSLHFKAGDANLRAEYMIGDNDGEETTGFYVMPSYMLSKKLEGVARFEASESDKSDGLRASSRYSRRGEFLKYEAVDKVTGETSTKVADKGDDHSAIYLGVNYYLNGDGNKLMFGVEMAELDNTKSGKLETTTLYTAWRTLF
jgi:hypothetical protein